MARRRLSPAQPGYLAAKPAAEENLSDSRGSLPLPAQSGAAPPIAKVSGQSAEAAALRELAEGVEAARRQGRMIVDVPLADIAPGHLVRDRMTLDREALDALKDSIRAHGQRIPAEITPLDAAAQEAGAEDDPEPSGRSPYRFGLISGWRRLRALDELCKETGDVRFSTLRALIRPPGEAAEAYVAMVEENEIRQGLSYYERARLVAEAAQRGVFPDEATALRTLFAVASRAKRSKIASFTRIHEELGDALRFPAEIPERLGLALAAQLKSGAGPRIRAGLAETRPATAKAEIALLERLVRVRDFRAPHASPPAEVLKPGLTMAATRRGRKISVTLSGEAVDDALLAEIREALRRLA